MQKQFKNLISVAITAYREWWAKDPFKESAVIAYYSIFSLPGLLVVIVTLAGYFFGQDAVNGRISSQITTTLGKATADQIQEIIAKAMVLKNSLVAAIIGVATILVGATGVFVQFQKSLDTIWKVKADPSKSGILSFLKARLFSFGLIISIAFILTVSLIISALLAALSYWVSSHFSTSLLIMISIFNSVLSLSILAVLFSIMFKFLPDAKVKWRHVHVGAFVTALLFEIGKFGLGLYFGKADPASGYGPAGSIVLILLWVSYSSMIVFYGAEFTFAHAQMQDGIIPPDENAKKIRESLKSG